MPQEIQLQVLPEVAASNHLLVDLVAKLTQTSSGEIQHITILKRSIDARQKQVKINLKIQVFFQGEDVVHRNIDFPNYKNVKNAPVAIVVGAGPAGYFAALQLIELGVKPIVIERGKDVRGRRRDLKAINRDHVVNPDSNYCFGEGGAGTYSDGKLYTRSKKRGNILKAMEWFVHFGAEDDILVDAHPHIGTNKLPKIITAMREAIIENGGEVHFNSKMTDIKIKDTAIEAIQINEGEWLEFDNVILATGHSARDIYYLLHRKNIRIEAKGFALGVRVEHPQELINHIQYHGEDDNPYLPPASYTLVEQVDGFGVYSFCMCPGGIIAPCATEQEEVVTNGWSPSKRNNPYANSGIVVTVAPSDLPDYKEDDPFVCLNYQKDVEKRCWEAGGKTQKVPAQRMIDFVEGKVSTDFPKTSYQPGIVSADLNEVLPTLLSGKLKKAFMAFGKKMKGYYTNEAVLHAPESRTSSPISVPRDPLTLEHIEISGLYPCGEGAGYAGGIISAAIDGINCVDAIVKKEELSV